MNEFDVFKPLINGYEINLTGQKLIKRDQSIVNFLGELIETMSTGSYDIDQLSQIGSGVYSLVFEYNDQIAFKISSQKTIQEYKGKHLLPEDLLMQFRVMDFLNQYFNYTNQKLIAPQQFFALQLNNGTGINFFEKIAWQDLDSYIASENLDSHQIEKINFLIKDEIKNRLTNPIIKMMLSDLKLNGSQNLNSNNILIDNFNDLLNTTYCIIDQPGHNQFLAKLAYSISQVFFKL